MATRGRFIDGRNFRVSPVTPFTYRDGLTYLEVLERLRKRDVELVELINAGLARASEELDAAIAKLWDDIEGPLARLDEYDAKINAEFAATREALRKAFETWQRQCDQTIAEAIERASDPDVMNWHRGLRTPLSVELKDSDNHYADHGLTAGDYTRKGFTAQEIEDCIWDVEHMAYRGIFVGPRANPRTMYNDKDGTLQSVRAQIAVAMEAALTGTGTTDVEVSELEQDAASDVIDRKVA